VIPARVLTRLVKKEFRRDRTVATLLKARPFHDFSPLPYSYISNLDREGGFVKRQTAGKAGGRMLFSDALVMGGMLSERIISFFDSGHFSKSG
jgi:hypothetical protein